MEYCVIRTIFSPQKQYRQFLISPALCMDSMLFITTKDSQDLCIHMVIPNTRLLIYVNLKYMSVTLDIMVITVLKPVDTASMKQSVPLLMGPVLLDAVLGTLNSCVRQNAKVETMV